MRYVFQVAYDGSRYFGFVRQPSRLTIEAELLKAFKECGMYRELKEARFRTAARTDHGVSAVGQIVALDVAKAIDQLSHPDLIPRHSNLLLQRATNFKRCNKLCIAQSH